MFRFILGIVFGVLALIFVFQNMEPISVTFLAWTIPPTSRAVILFILLAAGFIVGWAVGSIGRWRRRTRR